MTYYIYHIPGKKIGVTRDLKHRVEKQQGYEPDEYEVLMESDDILKISKYELMLQEVHGYRVDEIPYNELKFNNKEMNINVTEQTTTFPCPINKLKGRLMDNIGMKWDTDHGGFSITKNTIDWIMRNVVTSKYNSERCYVYNKAFARYYDNNDAYRSHDKLGGNLEDPHMRTRTGALSSDRAVVEKQLNTVKLAPHEDSQFDLIREWAETRGLYNNGDPKTQTLKLMEEAGEICRAVLKKDEPEIIDGIGDCVVVLTNLAHLCDTSIEECIEAAYNEIKNRKGKMENGTYVKDAK